MQQDSKVGIAISYKLNDINYLYSDNAITSCILISLNIKFIIKYEEKKLV